jgi:preprotein translocase subunit SecB
MSENETPQPEVNLRRIFVKDASLEMPSGAEIFNGEWNPKVDMDVSIKSRPLNDDHYEVALVLTVRVESGEKTAFLIEVHQAGIFLIKGLEQAQFNHAVGAFCPSILFPYAREAVDAMATKASFPPLLLAPINFDAMYEQNRKN